MTRKVSPKFPLKTPPVRPGVYKVYLKGIEPPRWSFWNGRHFCPTVRATEHRSLAVELSGSSRDKAIYTPKYQAQWQGTLK